MNEAAKRSRVPRSTLRGWVKQNLKHYNQVGAGRRPDAGERRWIVPSKLNEHAGRFVDSMIGGHIAMLASVSDGSTMRRTGTIIAVCYPSSCAWVVFVIVAQIISEARAITNVDNHRPATRSAVVSFRNRYDIALRRANSLDIKRAHATSRPRLQSHFSGLGQLMVAIGFKQEPNSEIYDSKVCYIYLIQLCKSYL